MGVTVKCEKTGSSCDLGYVGFGRFREKVARLLNENFGAHYAKLSTPEMMFAFDSNEREQIFDEFDREAERLIKKHKISKRAVDFLWQSDCEGKISPSACKTIYAAIKGYDDNICYGYAGRKDCAMFSDLKSLFKECCDNNSYLVWR